MSRTGTTTIAVLLGVLVLVVYLIGPQPRDIKAECARVTVDPVLVDRLRLTRADAEYIAADYARVACESRH